LFSRRQDLRGKELCPIVSNEVVDAIQPFWGWIASTLRARCRVA
jgi:hypothetical protein